jgi:hypothetical protein
MNVSEYQRELDRGDLAVNVVDLFEHGVTPPKVRL